MKSQTGILRQQIIWQPHQLDVFNGIYNFIHLVNYFQILMYKFSKPQLKRYGIQLYRNCYACPACLLVLCVAKLALLAFFLNNIIYLPLVSKLDFKTSSL